MFCFWACFEATFISVLQKLIVLVGNGGIPVGSMEGKRILFLSIPPRIQLADILSFGYFVELCHKIG